MGVGARTARLEKKDHAPVVFEVNFTLSGTREELGLESRGN